jgi:hypothetical protein
MATLRMPTGRRGEGAGADTKSPPSHEPRSAPHEAPGLLDDELLDLYAAILIVVPFALFLKSLWF